MVAKFLWSSWVPLTPEFILYSLSYKYTKSWNYILTNL
jgi:hypothetical protein